MEVNLQLWNSTRQVKLLGDIATCVKKICCIENHLYFLTTNNILYHGVTETTDNNEQLHLTQVDETRLIDIDCCKKYLYGIDETGKVWQYTDSVDVISEIKLIEDAKMCLHGHIGAKRKMKVSKITVGHFGILFITDSGQLWASGNMHQIRINSEVPKKVQFFDGRFVYDANVGNDFAIAIVSKPMSGDDTDSDECDGDVFVPNCPQCRSASQLTSPISMNSLSEGLGLGVPIQASYDIETTSTSSKNSASSNDIKKGFQNEEISENDELPTELDKAEKNIIFRNTEAAKEFLTRQFSSMSAVEEYLVEYSQKPTTIIKENITNMASLVYEGVKTVGDKVVTLSRHVSGSSETNDVFEVIEETQLPRITSKDEFTWSLSQGTSEKDLSEHGLQERTNSVLKNGSNLINCEVWTWGNIIHGQLGLGDIIKRDRPVIITKLSNIGAHKLSVQSFHASVLTLDGRAFLWGRNNEHQVTIESDRDQSSPKLFVTKVEERIKDIACGACHTSLLSSKFSIHYLGQNSNKVINLSECTEENGLKLESNNNKDFGNSSIYAASNYTLLNKSSNNSFAVEDLVFEQKFFEEMLTVHAYLIKPLQKKSFSISESALFETLCRTYADLLNFTAANIQSFLDFSNKMISDCDIIMFKYVDEYLFIYRNYLNTLHSIISINGCNHISKVVEIHQCLYKLDGITVTKKDKNSEEQIIFALLMKPFLRLINYEAIVRHFLQTTEKVQRFNEILSKWITLLDEQQIKKKQAEATKLFWVNSGKTLEQFKTPNRRLIRESHKNQIFLQNAGRFSSHWFILLTDILIHVNGSNINVHNLSVIWVEPQQEENSQQYQISLRMPEENLVLYTNDPEQKIEWLHHLQTAIKNSLNKHNAHQPPSVRSASYTFTKNGFFKDAKYTGRWTNGRMNGSGRIEWPDGKIYIGQFSNNMLYGFGHMETPNVGIFEGQWKENLQNGFGIFKYADGDVYKGYFKDGVRHGHGSLKQGHFMASAASVYIGDWVLGSKNGYGILDDIVTGEKYLGNWSENKKHGNGIIVTSDGIYYEGTFNQDVMTGHGLMILEDGTHYEGEFKGTRYLNGKGVLTLNSGQTIEGTLTGSWSDGIKISNGTLILPKEHYPDGSRTPKNFGKSCTPMKQKWKSLFRHCYQILGVPEKSNAKSMDTQKIWQNVAVVISNSHQGTLRKSKVDRGIENTINNLDTIPTFCREKIDKPSYKELQLYLAKAFECPYHPLGSLLSDITVAYTTSYGGLRAHPLLLSHAVDELHSISERLYEIVRLLFPALPTYGDEIQLDENDENDTISCESLLYPIILPKVHSPLFILYTLRNKKQEQQYWKRLLEWNKHSDYTLMAFLSVDQKFFKSNGLDMPASPSTSAIKDQTFIDAVESLQFLKTTFSPLEKLLVIRQTFQKMTKVVQDQLGPDYRWNMDDLFPVFLYVVVRARILQLGSELDFINDFMEPNLENGELGIMFTTLKACYHQILQEKISIT